METDVTCRPGHRFCEQVGQLHRMFCMQGMSLNLNPGEMMMLVQVEQFLERHPEKNGVKASQLTMDGYISKSAVSKMVGNLEGKGYLVRTASKEDRRVVYVGLTEFGKKSLEMEREYLDEKVDQIVVRMGRENMERLLELMDRWIFCAGEVFLH